MPLFQKRLTFWTAFPSSALPMWLQYVPIPSNHMAEAGEFRVHLTETGEDVRINDNVRFECSTLVHDIDKPFISSVVKENKGLRAQDATHKRYYTPVLHKGKISGVLIGRRLVGEEYQPINPLQKSHTPSNSQSFIAAFEGMSQPK